MAQDQEKLRISFFHIGDNTDQANMFCESVKKIFDQSAEIIQISDAKSRKAKGIDKIFRSSQFKKESIMLSRMIGYSQLLRLEPKPTVFFDTDMLIMKRFRINFNGKPILCLRSYDKQKLLKEYPYRTQSTKTIRFPEHKGQLLGDLYPYVGCFYADTSDIFLNKAIKIYESLHKKYHFWFGDQIALREAAKNTNILTIDESKIACDPSEYNGLQKEAIAIHFKGSKNKELMKDTFERIFKNE